MVYDKGLNLDDEVWPNVQFSILRIVFVAGGIHDGKMTSRSVVIFLLVQSLFTLGDLTSIWFEQDRPSLKKILKNHWQEITLVVGFWMIFFALQVTGLHFLPGLNNTDTHLRRLSGLLSSTGSGNSPTGSAQINAGFLIILTLMIVSFWDYVFHRFVFHSKWAWFLHEYHHLPTQVFNGMPGISVRPFVFATTLMTYGPTFLCLLIPLRLSHPATVEVFLQWIPVILFSLALILSIGHSHFLRRFPIVHRTLVWTGITSPQEHLYHHSRNRHGNFGNFSPLWDRLFGTYIIPESAHLKKEELGLSYDQDFLGTITIGQIKLSKRVRDEFKVGAFCNLNSVDDPGPQ